MGLIVKQEIGKQKPNKKKTKNYGTYKELYRNQNNGSFN